MFPTKGSTVPADQPEATANLPRTLMRAFAVADGRVRCKRCPFSCGPFADRILFHLTVCNGTVVPAETPAVARYECLACRFRTDRPAEWTRHLYAFDHVTNAAGRSYDCDSCGTHFYGPEDAVLRHRPCRPATLSSALSETMARAYADFETTRCVAYDYCADCARYSRGPSDLHAADDRCGGREPTVVCRACSITFHGARAGLAYARHGAYFEHAMLWCLNGDRTAQRTPASRFREQLPSRITGCFVVSQLLGRIGCVVCGGVETLSADRAYEHAVACAASKRVSDPDPGTPLRGFACAVCGDQHDERFDRDADVYRRWVNHVVGREHLKRTFVKGDRHYLFTYYCYVDETVRFGTAFDVQSKLWRTNDEIDRMLFVSEAMADVYRRANEFPHVAALYCCGVCLRYTDGDYCAHKGDPSFPSYYCSACLVEFNVRADYTEHLLSSEHIVLNYFKPGAAAELRIVEHAMENTKLCRSVMNESVESKEDGAESKEESAESTSESGDTIASSANDSAVATTAAEEPPPNGSPSRPVDFSAAASEYVMGLVEKLDRQPVKSGFTHVLRMKLELLLGAMTTTAAEFNARAFVESNCYFCCMCNVVCMDELIWTRHDQEFHADMENLSVFYCVTCHVYYINTSLEINAHIDSLEHGVMLDLNEYVTKHGEAVGWKAESERTQELTKNGEDGRKSVEIAPLNSCKKMLSVKTVDLLSDWRKLYSAITNKLQAMVTPTNESVISLCDSLLSLNVCTQSTVTVHIFGSQVYGLATTSSNMDVYVNMGASFCRDIANSYDLQVNMVQLFGKQCRLKPHEFRNVEEINDRRVPNIKFYHVPSKFNCVVSFKSEISVWTSKLIKLYLSMDNIVKWLACYVVKQWAPENGLISNDQFTSYTLVWMVLFYLMSEKVVPSLAVLMKHATQNDSKIIEGWDCSFGQWTKGVKPPDKSNLLTGFFQYYADEQNLKNNVQCTLTGKSMPKNQFYQQINQLYVISRIQRDQLKTVKLKIASNFEKNNGLAVQDPFDLSLNITEKITGNSLTDFCGLCDQSAKLLSKTKLIIK